MSPIRFGRVLNLSTTFAPSLGEVGKDRQRKKTGMAVE